jgi:CheY-like chemotaxis protein
MHRNPFHIFVVDDDEDDRYIFQKALKETSIPVVVSQMTNGIELLDCLKSDIGLPNIIFLDINMPLMDGLTALEQIRSNEAFRDVSIMIFSTSDNPVSIRTAYRLGAQLYLRKPDRYDDYLLLLKSILSYSEERYADIEAFIRR